jgi:hypothetical protein
MSKPSITCSGSTVSPPVLPLPATVLPSKRSTMSIGSGRCQRYAAGVPGPLAEKDLKFQGLLRYDLFPVLFRSCRVVVRVR